MKFLKPYTFHLLVFTVLLALILPVVLQDGMFMDGIQYACVSRNMAIGEGSFWFPWLNDSWMKAGSPYFMEHPPLVFGVQSLFFKVLGDTMYTERIYSVVTALVSACIIMRIWKLLLPNEKHSLSWLPVLLWIITPVCFWSYQNNMHENTMGIFTLLAVYYLLASVSAQKSKPYLYLVLAGIFVFAAFLCKGLPGLFPLGVLFLYYLVFRSVSFSKMLGYSLIVVVVSGSILLGLLFFHKPAYESLYFYFYERVAQRINEEPTVTSRFFILGSLLQELLPMLAVSILLGVVNLKKLFEDKTQRQWFLFFVLVGLSASLPVMLTTVQRGFYIVPAYPFFALAFAFLVKDNVSRLINKLNERTQTVLAATNALLLIVVVVVSVLFFAGKPGRDREVLSDVHEIGKNVPAGTQIKCDEEVYSQWNFHFYLTRYYSISLNYGEQNQKYILLRKSDETLLGREFKHQDANLKSYLLFKRK